MSLTIKGGLMALLPVIALLLTKYGVSQEMLAEIVNAVFGVVGAVMVLVGVVRKIYLKYKR